MKKILIVEDEKMLIEEVADWLNFEGYDIETALNGQEGLQKALEWKPDLILSDIMMPVMDGKRLLQEIKQRGLNTETVFILMTALSDRDQIRQGMELGADDYITKPFTRNELLQAIETRFEKSDRQKKSKEVALNDLRSRIMMHLPHELKTPLNAILGFASLLKDFPEDHSREYISEMASSILEGGTRLHRLIENYLLYVQLELRKELPLANISTRTIENILYEECYLLAKKYNRPEQFRIVLEAATIGSDEDSIRKICFELVDNAFRFSTRGTQVEISGLCNAPYYEMYIKNYGRGMTGEQIESIGAFMQFDRNTYEQQGSGLGLTIVKRLLELSGGNFEIRSEFGHWNMVICRFRLINEQ